MTYVSLYQCLTPVNICSGWEVTTVEGLGGGEAGYHPIQVALAETGGSQCGFCSPGMVMQLHSHLQHQQHSTPAQLENILDGNLCRCTGYRPILDAVKQFASEGHIGDIEDIKPCPNTGESCVGRCAGVRMVCGDNTQPSASWHHPTTLAELTQILGSFTPETKYRIVGGNTGTGVFKRDEESYDAFININNVTELKVESTDQMFLGGNVTITEAIAFFSRVGEAVPLWAALARHLGWIASVGIRNQATLAGNLMLKHAHHDFPSDVFLCLATVGAVLEIVDTTGASQQVTVEQFLTADMNRKFIKSIHFSASKWLQHKMDVGFNRIMRYPSEFFLNGGLKAGNAKTFIRTFKIMPRSSNAHAYVNAGFLAEVDQDNNFLIIGKPTLVFGGISSTFIHAVNTETFLMNKNMNDQEMFQQSLQILSNELEPDNNPALASQDYRKKLALSLFYKVLFSYFIVYLYFQSVHKIHLIKYVYCLCKATNLFAHSFSSMCLDLLHHLRFRVELIILREASPVATRAMTLMRISTQCQNPGRRWRADGRPLGRSNTQETPLSRLGSSRLLLSCHPEQTVTFPALTPLRLWQCQELLTMWTTEMFLVSTTGSLMDTTKLKRYFPVEKSIMLASQWASSLLRQEMLLLKLQGG